MEYLFNPFQLKEFGKKFFQDENQAFSYRYQLIKRFGFINSILVPFGPICKDFNGFKSFLKNILQRKFSKITIDLPMILDPQIKEEITHELLKQGFKLQEYKILDSETIVIKKEKFKPEKRVKRYIRSGYRNFDILIKKNLTESELNEIYSI